MPVDHPRGRDPQGWGDQDLTAVREFFAQKHEHVIYFGGYAELGYQNEGHVPEIVSDVLSAWTASDVLAHGSTMIRNSGFDGIAEMFDTARQLGVDTSGIFPSVSRRFAATHRVPDDCHHVFFVEDETWGGCVPGTGQPSSSLGLHIEVSDEAVFIGGGKHAADELLAFAAAGKPVTYFPAEMNHRFARDWCRRNGKDEPDLRGAAYSTWIDLCAERTAKTNPGSVSDRSV